MGESLEKLVEGIFLLLWPFSSSAATEIQPIRGVALSSKLCENLFRKIEC